MKQYKYDFYLGIADKDSFQPTDIEEAMARICAALGAMQLGFSVIRQEGGYCHADGTFVIEDSLRITFIHNEHDEDIEETVRILMEEFNQEQVLVSKKIVDARYLQEG